MTSFLIFSLIKPPPPKEIILLEEFSDLIGQDVMARTVTNSIKIGKTPNAYLLTGIRGVGKTTTARLIAKSLNCLKNLDKTKSCSSEKFCVSCQEIVQSNHMDVIEMDAKIGVIVSHCW